MPLSGFYCLCTVLFVCIHAEESAPDTTATDELLFRKSFHEGTELDSIDESDPIRFSYVSTVHSPMKPATVAATNSDEDIDSDTCIVGRYTAKCHLDSIGKHRVVLCEPFRFH